MTRTLEPATAPRDANAPVPGACAALMLLLAINLFNYIDRYVVASVEPQIAHAFFGGRKTTRRPWPRPDRSRPRSSCRT